MVATDNEVLHAQLRAFFSEKLSVKISSVDADLIQTGILDSLALVELLTYIEKEFGRKFLSTTSRLKIFIRSRRSRNMSMRIVRF